MIVFIMLIDHLLNEYCSQIKKGIEHLAYSYKKILKLSSDVKTLSTEDLETWEGFVARFGRVSDIFLSKYVRSYVLKGDPAFRGSLRDFVDQAEKLGLVNDSETWMTIRELRNSSAHEYSENKLSTDFEKMRELAPILIELKNKL